jgi:ornithine cyclodeaminase/alanine dehydrogenase-like protein (mu-crystallin family)
MERSLFLYPIDPGTQLNVVGSNFLSKAEVDVETIRCARVIAVDSIEQSRIEAGDLLPAIERGVISWKSVTELGRIVAGRDRGRTSNDDITLFKSNGVALEDISTALRVHNLARERGAGKASTSGQLSNTKARDTKHLSFICILSVSSRLLLNKRQI